VAISQSFPDGSFYEPILTAVEADDGGFAPWRKT